MAGRWFAPLDQPLTSRLDFNRDGVVNAADQLIARNNAGMLQMLDVHGLAESLVAGGQAASSHAALAFALALGDDDERGEELTHDAWRGGRR